MHPSAQPNKQKILENVLQEIVADGDYEAALLSDSNGLTLAVVAAQETNEMMAAMTALLREAAKQAQTMLDLGYVNELSLVGDDRFRLVCRFFQTDTGQPLSLTVVVPPDHAYRHLTNRAISKIKTTWTI
jgi:predicted regulator of Ras-like GTPase activity (Roadblock/LC7/MglB family)